MSENNMKFDAQPLVRVTSGPRAPRATRTMRRNWIRCSDIDEGWLVELLLVVHVYIESIELE